MYRYHIYLSAILSNFLFFSGILVCQTVNVTTNSDSGAGSLRQAMLDINAGSDTSNTINLQIPGNAPIAVSSDLPLTKKNTIINSTGRQIIDGSDQFRLFATIMADLTLTNCTLRNGAAIGGRSQGKFVGAGLGCGGGVYIDRGQTLTITNSSLTSNIAKGGRANSGGEPLMTGGASFSDGTKDQGGDYPGLATRGGSSDGSPFLTGYGGGGGNHSTQGGGDGPGHDAPDSAGGYCGGGGAGNPKFKQNYGGGGGNGGGAGIEHIHNTGGGGGGFGSGGYGGLGLSLIHI